VGDVQSVYFSKRKKIRNGWSWIFFVRRLALLRTLGDALRAKKKKKSTSISGKLEILTPLKERTPDFLLGP
jgi:hypothetical protein